jgi:predicted transcriptional regulator
LSAAFEVDFAPGNLKVSGNRQEMQACRLPPFCFALQDIIWYICRIMAASEKTISFRAKSDQIDALDSLASAQDRPRSYLINEAIANYVELHAYQDALVRKGLEEMRVGRVTSHAEVVKRIRKSGRARP